MIFPRLGTVLLIGRSQLLALAAQLIGALPIVALSIYFSHTHGLSTVADFALLIGVSSVAFIFAMTGLRSRLVLDQFRNFSEADYYILRMVSTAVMTVLIIVAGLTLGAPAILSLAVALMRVGDAALDLTMAIDQVYCNPREHMYGYLYGSIFKLVIIAIFLAGAEQTKVIDQFSAFAMACGIYAVYAWVLFLNRRKDRSALFMASSLKKVIRLIRHSVAFAIAQILCAFLTAIPRFALPWIPDRDLAGAAGAALSSSTLIGMAYFSIWLRWIPRFGKEGLRSDQVAMFILETGIVLTLILVSVWIIGGPAIAWIFAIKNPAYVHMAVKTLFASCFFFFVMTIANLYKPTRLPWAESAIYLGGIGAIGILVLTLQQISVPMMLVTGTFGMLVFVLFTLVLLKHSHLGEVV